ncbi:MAG TPA: DUF485 domain-containing protein [Gemmatimonas aurantiaca]|uniref:DUF485 domain-containing protein n=2 Tax=Gemmatimonas aurantiaca TaxID=173480 RepID=A0A3D4V789_9BACT|nr:DUF485 domain-containing protein [Gemmatimonas aurantiaca]BAH38196.1 hypothetical membrane protein [Gemmatimonas aurantiaca T-27]HCT56970.1 DUF485 domain-containing protein [Gemmatimonas aurantiaca]
MTPDPKSAALAATRQLAAQRWRTALLLTISMVLVYFGFILLVAFNPALLGRRVGEGLSLGIVLGALVIVAAWLLTFTYVSWANRVYDPALRALREQHRAASQGGAP